MLACCNSSLLRDGGCCLQVLHLRDVLETSLDLPARLQDNLANCWPYSCSVEASRVIVEETRLYSIVVSFGSVKSSISLPCYMSHASIPAEVRVFAV